MRKLSPIFTIALCMLMCACQSTALTETSHVRVSAHYIASGSVGQATAYVYADKTVIEMETAANNVLLADASNIPYQSSIDGRYIRLETIAKDFHLHLGARSIHFTLEPVAKIYSANGVVLAPSP
jgi:hypothetical protein